jgi:hypothetical protein
LKGIISIERLAFLVVLAATVLYLRVIINQKNLIEMQLRSESLRSELLLSEKLLEHKENIRLRADFETSVATDRVNALNFEHTAVPVADMLSMSTDKRRTESIDNQERAIQDLREKLIRDSLTNFQRLAALDSMRLILERDQIADIMEKQTLIDEIDRLSAVTINGTLVEARTSKKRLTSRARKTTQLRAIVQVSDQLRNLNFKIVGINGDELPMHRDNFALKITDPAPTANPNLVFVSSEIYMNVTKKLRQVEVTYHCKKKLQPGIYSIIAYEGGYEIGNFRIELD